MLKRLLLALLVAALPTQGFAQATILQGGSYTEGLVPTYSTPGSPQPVVRQSGPASGSGAGIKELSVIARGSGTAPYAAQGTGQLGSIVQIQDAPTSNSTGYHAFSLSPNDGTGGLLAYGAYGGASSLPMRFYVNGTYYTFPFTTNGAVGPSSTTVGHIAVWNNTTGTLLADGGTALSSTGGTNGQVQYNNAGVLGGFTVGGDGTLNTGTGSLTVSKIGGVAVSLGGAVSTAGALTTGGPFITSGASSLTLTTSGVTNVSLPASGTLATLAGSEALTNKTVNGLTISNVTGSTLTFANNKVFTISNTLTLTATDGSTLAIGTGGTLGTAAYTAATAYVPSNTQTTDSLSSDVPMGSAGVYVAGPTLTQGSTGTWFASGSVTIQCAGADRFNVKLWDGTNVIDSARVLLANAGDPIQVALSGYRASPAGNIRISVAPATRTDCVIAFNESGNSKDSTLSAFRVN